MTELASSLIPSIGTGQDCAASGYWAVTYLRRANSPAIVGRIGRTPNRRWHVVLGDQETHTATMEQATAWLNRWA